MKAGFDSFTQLHAKIRQEMGPWLAEQQQQIDAMELIIEQFHAHLAQRAQMRKDALIGCGLWILFISAIYGVISWIF